MCFSDVTESRIYNYRKCYVKYTGDHKQLDLRTLTEVFWERDKFGGHFSVHKNNI